MKNYFYVLIYGIFGTIIQFLLSFSFTYSLTNSSIFNYNLDNLWYPPKNSTDEDQSFYS